MECICALEDTDNNNRAPSVGLMDTPRSILLRLGKSKTTKITISWSLMASQRRNPDNL